MEEEDRAKKEWDAEDNAEDAQMAEEDADRDMTFDEAWLELEKGKERALEWADDQEELQGLLDEFRATCGRWSDLAKGGKVPGSLVPRGTRLDKIQTEFTRAERMNAMETEMRRECLPVLQDLVAYCRMLGRPQLKFEPALWLSSRESLGIPLLKVKVTHIEFGDSVALSLEAADKIRAILHDELVNLNMAIAYNRQYELPEAHDPISLMFDNSAHYGSAMVKLVDLAYVPRSAPFPSHPHSPPPPPLPLPSPPPPPPPGTSWRRRSTSAWCRCCPPSRPSSRSASCSCTGSPWPTPRT
jgi:hypothetical protein